MRRTKTSRAKRTLIRTFLNRLRPVLLAGLAAALAIPALTVPMIAAAPAAHADSSVGGQITRSEVLNRAKNWLNRQPALRYNSSRAAGTLVSDVEGAHKYGPDCSGMVSMAWHLNPGSYGGLNTSTLPSVSYKINRSALLPGDALDSVSEGHVVLFDAWEADHVHFTFYSFGGNPMRHYTHASFSCSAGSFMFPTVTASCYQRNFSVSVEM